MVPVDQQGVCTVLVYSTWHVGEGVQIPFYFFRDNFERTFPKDLGDDCNVKMRSRAGLVVTSLRAPAAFSSKSDRQA